jgi:hypothetical protein
MRAHIETVVVVALVIALVIMVATLTGCQVPLRNY